MRARGATAVAWYTLLRVAIFFAAWFLLQFTTPLRGIGAVVVALLVSGLISLLVLDRQRDAVGSVAAGLFGRINARIDASARAEDELLPDPETDAEADAVQQQDDPTLLQDGDEFGPDRT
jgi:hypothetical protein